MLRLRLPHMHSAVNQWRKMYSALSEVYCNIHSFPCGPSKLAPFSNIPRRRAASLWWHRCSNTALSTLRLSRRRPSIVVHITWSPLLHLRLKLCGAEVTFTSFKQSISPCPQLKDTQSSQWETRQCCQGEDQSREHKLTCSYQQNIVKVSEVRGLILQ